MFPANYSLLQAFYCKHTTRTGVHCWAYRDRQKPCLLMRWQQVTGLERLGYQTYWLLWCGWVLPSGTGNSRWNQHLGRHCDIQSCSQKADDGGGERQWGRLAVQQTSPAWISNPGTLPVAPLTAPHKQQTTPTPQPVALPLWLCGQLSAFQWGGGAGGS